jgi:RNA polymerase sigma factor (sigma-70 family)
MTASSDVTRMRESAYQEIVDRLSPAVKNMAARHANGWHEHRDDLETEGWIAIFSILPSIGPQIPDPAGWLLRNARWRMLDYIKRTKEWRHVQIHTMVVTEDCAEEAIENALAAEVATHLTPLQGAILRARREGLTCRQIAAKVGCNHGYVSRALRRIQQVYRRDEGER